MEAGRKDGKGSAPNKLCASTLCVHGPSPALTTHSALCTHMLMLLFPLPVHIGSLKGVSSGIYGYFCGHLAYSVPLTPSNNTHFKGTL